MIGKIRQDLGIGFRRCDEVEGCLLYLLVRLLCMSLDNDIPSAVGVHG
jgi:hypothetical protein